LDKKSKKQIRCLIDVAHCVGKSYKFIFGEANRLTGVSDGTDAWQYVYNGLGDRVQSILNSTATTYTLDLNTGLTQVLADGTNTYTYGLNRISQVAETQTGYYLTDALGSVRQVLSPENEVLLAREYSPYGETVSSIGDYETDYSYTGEMTDGTGLVNLRARYYDPGTGRFISKDTWIGDYNNPITLVKWMYANGNPIFFIDPSGLTSTGLGGKNISCPIGNWDCEAVKNISVLKYAFLDSASRHNRIPSMDTNGFAGLLAATIVSERRIGNVPPTNDQRNRQSQKIEDILASFGCTVSGHYLKGAIEDQDIVQLLRYLFNVDVPQRATVGIGNVWLETAANIWKNQACDSNGNCVSVSTSEMQIQNGSKLIDIANPYGTQIACLNSCYYYRPSENESYVIMTQQLLNWKMNIEYVATNLEAGALRAITLGITPTAYNSATWHLRGLQSDKEILDSGWNPGGANYILNDIPTALQVFGLTSSWNVSLEVNNGR
jgi:RHS repeat-associated protein